MKKIMQSIVLVTGLFWGISVYTSEDMKPMKEGESLLVIMQQLDMDYAALNAAIFKGNFEAMAEAAQNIAHHDAIPMVTKKKLKANLGEDMKMFKQADMKVHHLALGIEQAANAKNIKTVIAKQSLMLGACMACHTSYRS